MLLSRFFTIAFFMAISINATGQKSSETAKRVFYGPDEIPAPAQDPDMLFYLQRTLDLNSVIYSGKYVPDTNGHKKLDEENPVDIYWLTDEKVKKPLSKIQRLGYGVSSENLRGDVMQLKLVAYRDMTILLKPSEKRDRYHAHIALEGKDVLLTKVFINIDGGTKLKPNVTFIEITGTETQTGRKLVHRFKP
jgi:hypothetical protein